MAAVYAHTTSPWANTQRQAALQRLIKGSFVHALAHTHTHTHTHTLTHAAPLWSGDTDRFAVSVHRGPVPVKPCRDVKVSKHEVTHVHISASFWLFFRIFIDRWPFPVTACLCQDRATCQDRTRVVSWTVSVPYQMWLCEGTLLHIDALCSIQQYYSRVVAPFLLPYSKRKETLYWWF